MNEEGPGSKENDRGVKRVLKRETNDNGEGVIGG